jgi:hypothetical protein
MGWLKKTFKKIISVPKKIVDKAIDTVTDVGKAIVNIAMSPFTGGFDIPDINIDTTAAIDQATTVDFAPSNTPIPVGYGRYVERGVKNIFIDTAGDKNQFLYTCGVIGLGMTQDDNAGSRLWNLQIDDAICDITTATKSGNISIYTSDTTSRDINTSAINGDGFPRFGGKGGTQPPIYTVKTGRFKDRVQFQLFDGSDDQPASSLLKESDKWNDEHRLKGINYIAMKFTWTQDEIKDENGDNLTNPFSSLPRVVVMSPGKNVPKLVRAKKSSPGYEHDTDTNTSGDDYSTMPTPADWSVVFASGAYTNNGTRQTGYDVSGNPVEILLDYMLNDRFGPGIALSKIDQASFVNAAVATGRVRAESSGSIFATNLFGNLFSGNATYPDVKLNRIVGKDTDARVSDLTYENTPYYRQFIIDTGASHLQNINRLLTSIGGIMPFVNGKYKLTIENAGTPDNSFDIPSVTDLKSSNTFTFTDDNIVDGITFQGGALENTFNNIKLNYTDIENRSQNNSVIWPLKTDTQYAQYKREDNDLDLLGNVTNAGIVNASHAAHYAKVLTKKSRQQQSIAFKTTEAATNLVPGDIIRVNSAVLSIDHLFRITQLTLDQYGDIEISAFRHYPDAYDFDDANLFDQIISASQFITNSITKPPVINPAPNVFKAPQGFIARSIRISQEQFNFTVSHFYFSWRDTNVNAGHNRYEVQAKTNQENESEFATILNTNSSSSRFSTFAFPIGATINFRVRTISQNGSVSGFTETSVSNQAFFGAPIKDKLIPTNANYWLDFADLSSGAGTGTASGDGTTIDTQKQGEI